MHGVIDAARSRCQYDPAHRATTGAIAIFGRLDPDVRFILCSALFGCFGPGAQHRVWKRRLANLVGMGGWDEQSPKDNQPRNSHGLSSFVACLDRRDVKLASRLEKQTK